jgi:Zn-dependent protease with chaperone function
MTNFFERQRKARWQTWFLGLIFIIAFILIIFFTALWTSKLFGNRISKTLPYSAIIVLVFIASATFYRVLTLIQGGAKVAQQLGATPLPENITDFQLRRLRNVVEEIAIASGAPLPDIFVLDKELGINAFASGFSPADAAITVTRGALNALNRDELQAVIAHEFSHIQNGDMRLNTQLVSVLFGISLIGLMGYRILCTRLRGKGSGRIYIFAFGLFVIGSVGLLASRIIKAGINRQREYLADACAVQYTRQNLGLSGALKKIAGVTKGSSIANKDASEYEHMFFSQGFSFSNLFATHPPLLTRIKLLEPDFSTENIDQLKKQWLSEPPDGAQEDIALGFAEKTPTQIKPHILVAAETIAQKVGTSDLTNYQQAKTIIEGIPDLLLRAARNYYAVIPLLFAMIYSSDPSIRAKQNDLIKSRHSNKTLANIEAFASKIASLNTRQRLPLAMLAFPALRQCPREKLNQFIASINLLVSADENVTLFEYLFTHLLTVQINDFINPTDTLREGNRTIKSSAIAVSKLMAVMAQAGQQTPTETEIAYETGMNMALPKSSIAYEPVSAFAATLDPVWTALDGLNAEGKQRLLEGLVAAMRHDGIITLDESDLLRAACTSLHIPLPMLCDEAN